MKLITSFLILLISFSLFAQSDDYCPCMDPPRYFDNSFLDSLLFIDDELPFSYTTSEESKPVLVTDRYYEEQETSNVPVALFVDKPVNISPSDVEKKVNVSPKDEMESEASIEKEPRAKVRREAIKQKRKRIKGKIKRRKKARKYKGKCPMF